MGVMRGRWLAASVAAGALLAASACGEPPPPDPGPLTEVLAGSFTGGVNERTVAGPICVEVASTLVVTIEGNDNPVRVWAPPPTGEDQTTWRNVYAGGGTVRFAVEAGCHTVRVGFGSGMLDPAEVGGSFDWTLAAEPTGPLMVSPTTWQIGRQFDRYTATEITDAICAPVGTGIEVASPDPSAPAIQVALLDDDPLELSDLLPLLPGRTQVLPTTKPCQQLLLSIGSFAGLSDAFHPVEIAWPVAVPPSAITATVTTTGTEPVGTVLWEDTERCLASSTGMALDIEGNLTDVRAVAAPTLLEGLPVTTHRTTVVPAGGGRRYVDYEMICHRLQVIQAPEGVGVAQTFEVHLEWPAPAPTVPWTNELAPHGGATDRICDSSAALRGHEVSVSGATGGWVVHRVYSEGVVDSRSGSGDGTVAFDASTYVACVRFVVEHTPDEGEPAGPLTVTVSVLDAG